MKKQRRRLSSNAPRFEKLEDRRLLTTLYLDFGDRLPSGSLSFTEQQFIADLGGTALGDLADDDTITLETLDASRFPFRFK